MEDESAPWRPLSHRNDPTYDTLYEFVPGWLMPSIIAWIHPVFEWQDEHGRMRRETEKLHEVERRLHTELNWQKGPSGAAETLEMYMTHDKNKTFALDVVDLIASWLTNSWDRGKLAELERCLNQGGSAWTVSTRGGLPGLVRRVDPTVADAAAKVMDESGRAGELLGKAWRSVYGRNPDASAGYRDAVRAVEAAAKPVVSPNNPITTLGTVIRDIDAAPKKWALQLTPSGGVDAIDTVVRMCKLLWKSQLDRHGTSDEGVPLNVSNKEAETALHLATTLVHWFSSGAITQTGKVGTALHTRET